MSIFKPRKPPPVKLPRTVPVVGSGLAPAEARALYRTAQKNAARRGILFELSMDEFSELWWESSGACALTGIGFDLIGKHRGTWRRNPWAASLDRIESHLGYTKANCRLVCSVVNIALNEWGADVLMKVAAGLRGHTPADLAPGNPKTGLAIGIYRVVNKGGRVTYRVRPAGKNRETIGTFQTYEAAIAALEKAKEYRDIGLIKDQNQRQAPEASEKAIYIQ